MKRPAGRVVSISNGAFAAVLVAVLAAVALVVSPPAPPGIAEFAPNATKPISKAPLGQAASAGQRTIAVCGGRASCSPSARPSPSTGSAGTGLQIPKLRGVASVLQCYTWPDGSVTQTFDPQSPPCIASWDAAKGNGGATTTGVTASEIRVALPNDGNGISALEQATVNVINGEFVLYGRKIRLVPVTTSEVYGPQGESTPWGMRAAARKVISLKPFAALADYVAVAPFVQELARAHVVAVTSPVSEMTSGFQTRLAPYVWSYQPGLDVVQRNLASLACSALVGRKAIHGGPDVTGQTRKFALVLHDDDTFDTRPLTDALAACGSPARVVRIKTSAPPGDPATTQQFLQLKADGYTSLFTFAFGWSTFEGVFATNAGYTPEWIIPGMGDQAQEGFFAAQGQRQQLADAFGLGTWNKLMPWSDEPWYRTASSAGVQPSAGNNGNFYHSLLVLAAGIQMAGPRLTAQTMADGLHATTFANPGAGAAPAWQANVGFGTGYSMVRDAALVWWNQSQRDYSSSATGSANGGWCSLDRGRRFTEGTWPKSDPPMSKTGSCG